MVMIIMVSICSRLETTSCLSTDAQHLEQDDRVAVDIHLLFSFVFQAFSFLPL